VQKQFLKAFLTFSHTFHKLNQLASPPRDQPSQRNIRRSIASYNDPIVTGGYQPFQPLQVDANVIHQQQSSGSNTSASNDKFGTTKTPQSPNRTLPMLYHLRTNPPTSDSYAVLKLNNIPWDLSMKDVQEFFKPIPVRYLERDCNMHIIRSNMLIAYGRPCETSIYSGKCRICICPFVNNTLTAFSLGCAYCNGQKDRQNTRRCIRRIS
jgi:hypothetical protein